MKSRRGGPRIAFDVIVVKTPWAFIFLILCLASFQGARGAMADTPFEGQLQDYSRYLEQERSALKAAGFKHWKWQDSHCKDCPIRILPRHAQIEDQRVYDFIRAIEDEKFKLMELMGGSCQEYNLLAHMAVGILGRESKFFESTRYKWKEGAPGVIKAIKVVQAHVSYYQKEARRLWNWENRSEDDEGPKVEASSRGPTQIKDIPQAISEEYGVTPDNLHEPKKAAVATMGYLMLALRELKNRMKSESLDYINRSNYIDYLPYIYFGSRWKLYPSAKNPHNVPDATPYENIYIMDMQSYMNWVEIYEAPANSPQGKP